MYMTFYTTNSKAFTRKGIESLVVTQDVMKPVQNILYKWPNICQMEQQLKSRNKIENMELDCFSINETKQWANRTFQKIRELK